MSETKAAAKKMFGFSISTWVNFFIGFLSTFILTRLFIPEVLGVINLFYSSVTTLVSVFCLGLDSSLIRYYYVPPQKEDIRIFILKLILPCLVTCFVVGSICCLFFGNEISVFFLGKEESILCICLIIGVIDQILLRFLNIIYRMVDNVKDFNIQAIIINIVTKLSVILGVLIDSTSAIIAILFNVLTISLVALYYVIKQKKEWFPNTINLDYKNYNYVIKFAFFSWLSLFLIQALTLSSQLVINNKLNLKAVGIYTAAGVFTAILSVVKGGFCTFWSAYMYKNYREESKRVFINKMHEVVLFFCIVFCAVLFSSRFFIYLYIGEAYRSSKIFFSLLIYFPLLQTIQETTGYGISIKNKNYILTIIMAITIVINVALSLILIDEFGLIAVAWVNFLCAIISYLLTTIYAQKLYMTISNIRKSVFGLVVLIIEGIVPVFVTSDILLASFMFLIIIVALFLYRDITKRLLVYGISFIKFRI